MDNALELRIGFIEKDLAEQEAELKSQGETLNKITKLLEQIRWMGVGALGFFVLNNIGLLEVVRKTLGI